VSRIARSRARVVSRRGIECSYCPLDNSRIKAGSGPRPRQNLCDHPTDRLAAITVVLEIG
jgi:hypothetical protein